MRKDDHLCAGLKSGIDGAVYRVKYIWEANPTKENWGSLLFDAKNAFNNIN